MKLSNFRLFLVAILFLLNACANNSLLLSSSNTLKIESIPTTADVFVMGNKIGTTPMQAPLNKIYPVSYPADQQSIYGQIQLKKFGCRSYSHLINRSDAANGIKIELDCDTVEVATTIPSSQQEVEVLIVHSPAQSNSAPIPKPEPEPTLIPVPVPIPATEPSTDKSAKQRLLQLNDLYKDGLISEQEFQHIRQQILDSL